MECKKELDWVSEAPRQNANAPCRVASWNAFQKVNVLRDPKMHRGTRTAEDNSEVGAASPIGLHPTSRLGSANRLGMMPLSQRTSLRNIIHEMIRLSAGRLSRDNFTRSPLTSVLFVS